MSLLNLWIQSYSEYLDRENAKYREAALNYYMNNLFVTWYDIVLELLYASVENTADLTGILVPKYPDEMEYLDCPVKLKNGVVPALIFTGYNSRGNDVTASSMSKILTREMRRIASNRNIPVVFRVVVFQLERQLIKYAVFAEADIQAYQNRTAANSRPEIKL